MIVPNSREVSSSKRLTQQVKHTRNIAFSTILNCKVSLTAINSSVSAHVISRMNKLGKNEEASKIPGSTKEMIKKIEY